MRHRSLVLALTFASSSLACQVVIADDCDYTAPRQAALDATGAREVVVEAGAGSLAVRGGDGAELQARGTACASREGLLDQILLETERRGDTLHVRTRFPRNVRGTARLDLEIDLPRDLHVRVDDGSGSVVVRNVASLDLEDGSGSLEVTEVAGDVTIDDGSGSIDLRDVRGAVAIDDGSGSIDVLGVGGSMEVDDGSGGIELRGVGGDVRITDGSGSIVTRDVDGNVTVTEDGSGGIVVSGVGGSVLVGSDGSGSIRVEEVRGDFTVERDGSGGISFSNVDGRVSIPPD